MESLIHCILIYTRKELTLNAYKKIKMQSKGGPEGPPVLTDNFAA
jgi:hypothetical protein